MTLTLRDRAAGSLVGVAIGSALGSPLDFLERDQAPELTELLGGGIHGLPPRAWSQEASLAVCLSDSLIAHQRLVPDDIMRRFLRWWLEGEGSSVGYCFTVDPPTLGALQRFLRTGDAFAGERDETKTTAACLARVAPIAIFRHGHPDAARNEACTQASLTHDTELGLELSELVATMLVEALDGASKTEILRPRPWLGHPAVNLMALGSWKMKTREQVRSTSDALEAFEAALWALEDAGSFEQALTRAVNLAGAASAIGAMAGQIAGAIWGLSGIPERWFNGLIGAEAFELRAYQLLDAGTANRAFERHGCVKASLSRKRLGGPLRQGWSPLGPAN